MIKSHKNTKNELFLEGVQGLQGYTNINTYNNYVKCCQIPHLFLYSHILPKSITDSLKQLLVGVIMYNYYINKKIVKNVLKYN